MIINNPNHKTILPAKKVRFQLNRTPKTSPGSARLPPGSAFHPTPKLIHCLHNGPAGPSLFLDPVIFNADHMEHIVVNGNIIHFNHQVGVQILEQHHCGLRAADIALYAG